MVSKKPILELDNAEVRYQDAIALQQIDLCLYEGESIALIGKSGSGKSTLLKLIYEHLSNNTVLVPQDEGLVANLSVFHNVYMGRLSQHPTWYNLLNLMRPFPARVSEVYAILQRLNLTEKCFVLTSQLSGGQRQRTAIARALYQAGELVLADEPVSAVDEQQARHIIAELKQQFKTMVVALHDTSLAVAYCDRIIGLETGRIVLDTPAESVSADQLRDLYSDKPSS